MAAAGSSPPYVWILLTGTGTGCSAANAASKEPPPLSRQPARRAPAPGAASTAGGAQGVLANWGLGGTTGTERTCCTHTLRAARRAGALPSPRSAGTGGHGQPGGAAG